MLIHFKINSIYCCPFIYLIIYSAVANTQPILNSAEISEKFYRVVITRFSVIFRKDDLICAYVPKTIVDNNTWILLCTLISNTYIDITSRKQ